MQFFHTSGIIIRTGNDIYFYGPPTPDTPATETQTPFRQATGYQRWRQAFDVLRLNADNSITVVALNVLAVQQSTLSLPDVASDVSVTEQLRNVTWMPLVTVPNIRLGDIIVPAQGLTADAIQAVPAGNRITVTGISQQGGKTQFINAESPVAN